MPPHGLNLRASASLKSQCFGTSLKKIGERVSVHDLRQVGSVFGGDRAKRPMGMKARLARSLGGFYTSWTKESSLG